jgi:hypothetical protein
MRSGHNSSRELDSSSSLEIALDQAIAHRFSSVQERSTKKRRNSPVPTSLALTVTSKETTLALVPARLIWRGIEVPDEFQEYAARVARGEQLAPYRGVVLSRHCPEFPWSSAPAPSTTSPTPTLPEYPKRGRSLKTLLTIVAAVGSVVGALGVGAGGKAMTVADTFARSPVQASAALTPAPTAVDARSAAVLESAAPDALLGAVTPELEPSTLAPEAPNALPVTAPQRPVRSPELQRPPLARTTAAPGKSPLLDPSRLTLPSTPATTASPSRNPGTLATAVPVPSLRDSTLFSEKAPF